jgi:hypothetical protein
MVVKRGARVPGRGGVAEEAHPLAATSAVQPLVREVHGGDTHHPHPCVLLYRLVGLCGCMVLHTVWVCAINHIQSGFVHSTESKLPSDLAMACLLGGCLVCVYVRRRAAKSCEQDATCDGESVVCRRTLKPNGEECL